MGSFVYTARDKTGAVNKGTLYADDRASAAASLIEKGLTPILVKEGAAETATGALELLAKFKRRRRVKLTEKVIFSRQLSTMINAGIPIAQALGILSEQTPSPVLQEAIKHISKEVEGGQPLSKALAAYPHIFSAVYVNMVKAGETGGMLDQVLERLATQQEKDAEIIGKVRGAMIYPAVITTVTFGAFFFLMTVIVPKLAVIFEGFGGELPVYTRIMLATSKFLTRYGIFLLIGLVVLTVLFFRYARKNAAGKRLFDRILLRMPVIGKIIIKVNVARFARTFGSLMSAGIAVLDALNTTADSLNNSVFKEHLRKVATEVKNGKSISVPLKQSAVFPPIVGQMVSVGEETGKLDAVLFKVADFYEKEVDVVVSGITSIIEPVLMIVLGFLVGGIVISVFGPISQLSDQI